MTFTDMCSLLWHSTRQICSSEYFDLWL